MKMRRKGLKRLAMSQFIRGCLLIMLIMGVTASSSHSASSDWKPEKNVELIIATSPGSGSDMLGRMVQTLFQTKGIVKTSVTVVNKPGGGQTVAMVYLNEHAGDGHYLMFSSPSVINNYIIGTSTLNYTDFTPIAIMGIEPVVYAVNADSPIKTGKDLVDRLRKDPKSLSIGVAAALGNHNHVAAGLVMKEAGGDVKNLKVVIFDSSSKGMMALMGGHIDLTMCSVDSVFQHVQTGKVRVIAVGSEKRLEGEVSKFPTWKEQGFNIVISNSRTVMGPKGMSEAQMAYWDDVFAKLVQLNEWKKFEKDGFSQPFYLKSTEAKKFFDSEFGRIKAVLTDLGMAKK